MFKTVTEQDWVDEYIKSKKNPSPVVLGTRGTWTGNRKPMIILGFSMVDVLVLGDIYGVSHHPVRKMKSKNITYYAINIIEKKKVKEIIEEWKVK
ncbi:hypothetical protein [Bacillus sinesaloumensis]|uniref:hypothetical protein n=1 Tax=Litchfieldia sinesaloumensis TaxID=1926280 RepID=UPI00098844B1|nr:hypothetical protein [Bacillus sinesaloumensis]